MRCYICDRLDTDLPKVQLVYDKKARGYVCSSCEYLPPEAYDTEDVLAYIPSTSGEDRNDLELSKVLEDAGLGSRTERDPYES